MSVCYATNVVVNISSHAWLDSVLPPAVSWTHLLGLVKPNTRAHFFEMTSSLSDS